MTKRLANYRIIERQEHQMALLRQQIVINITRVDHLRQRIALISYHTVWIWLGGLFAGYQLGVWLS
jgi:hypothetical protein